MIEACSLIILNYTRYSDSSAIVNAISDTHGRISFLVYGINKKNKLTAFQPLFLMEAELYIKPSRTLQKIKEFKIAPPLFSLTSDIRKSAIALFIAELLSKTIRESHLEKSLFTFLKTSILMLEEVEDNLSVFHLVFLLKFSRYLGFAPESEIETPLYFDFKENRSTPYKPYHNQYFTPYEFDLCSKFLTADISQLENYNVSKSTRNALMDKVLMLYEIHILNFSSLKSYTVLREVFSS